MWLSSAFAAPWWCGTAFVCFRLLYCFHFMFFCHCLRGCHFLPCGVHLGCPIFHGSKEAGSGLIWPKVPCHVSIGASGAKRFQGKGSRHADRCAETRGRSCLSTSGCASAHPGTRLSVSFESSPTPVPSPPYHVSNGASGALQPAGSPACGLPSLRALRPAGSPACGLSGLRASRPAGPSACGLFSLRALQLRRLWPASS